MYSAGARCHATGKCFITMNKQPILRGMAGILVLTGLSACSTIKSWFPDKERDYQFTSEIPALIVPEELKNKGMAPISTSTVAAASAAQTESITASDAVTALDDSQATSSTPEPATAESQSPAETTPTSTASAGVSTLQIDQAKTPATRMVGRAMSRKKLEIVERNIDKGYFYVKYDPDAVKASDESIWDELNFLFGDDPSQEQEYRVTVRGIGPQTSEVTVQDSEGKTLSNAPANALLKQITEGINEVVNQDAAAPAPAPESAPITPESPVIEE